MVITDHGGPIVGPVSVLTLHGTVKLDEFLYRCVVRVAGHGRQVSASSAKRGSITAAGEAGEKGVDRQIPPAVY